MIGLSALAMKYPLLAALIVLVGVVLMVTFATWIARAIKRRWKRQPPALPAGTAVRP